MSKTNDAADVQDAARRAGSDYRFLIDFSFDDAQNGLHYMLLRLSILRLTEQDRKELLELGRLALQESDVAEAATRIKDRADASPLAVAIANIVASAFGSKRAVMLGAVFGAYRGLRESRRDALEGIEGAVAGAVAASTAWFLRDQLERRALSKFTQPPPESAPAASPQRSSKADKSSAKKGGKSSTKKAGRRG